MNISMLVRARKHFNSGMPAIDRHNRRAWVSSIRRLGPRWALLIKVARLS